MYCFCTYRDNEEIQRVRSRCIPRIVEACKSACRISKIRYQIYHLPPPYLSATAPTHQSAAPKAHIPSRPYLVSWDSATPTFTMLREVVSSLSLLPNSRIQGCWSGPACRQCSASLPQVGMRCRRLTYDVIRALVEVPAFGAVDGCARDVHE
jgi:hypothetical protein